MSLGYHVGTEYGQVERAGLFSIVPLTGYMSLWTKEADSITMASSGQAYPSFHRERY